MFNKIFILSVSLLYGVAFADDCIKYKNVPNINILNPSYTKSVTQPDEPMNKLHGNVLATLVQDFDIVVDIVAKDTGYCVTLKKLDASIGYSNFEIKIDKSHIRGSCSYNAILGHEDKHINAYLSVMKDMMSDIKNSVFNATNSIMPVFVESREDIELVIEKMNNEIQSHPEVILLKQKINAAQEIRNKRVDQNEDNSELKRCFLGN
ncbi:MAG: hypothetical protein J5742_02305 [Alphaproteobacteria bacterium]|nr:hypothetical protein [Alphaproteobacteria bacterium]